MTYHKTKKIKPPIKSLDPAKSEMLTLPGNDYEKLLCVTPNRRHPTSKSINSIGKIYAQQLHKWMRCSLPSYIYSNLKAILIAEGLDSADKLFLEIKDLP